MKDNTRLTPKNDILNALPADDLARLTPLLEHVDLPHGKVLYQPDVPIKHVYFPEHAMISVVAYTDDGQATEVAVIGGEGATGVSVVMGSNSTHYENIVQLPNGGWRIKTKDVREEFARNGALHDLLLRFTNKLLVQVSQTALCNRVHTVEKRLSKWLLMSSDRTESNEMHLTQELLAMMLGANRTTVTRTAIVLQDAGFISYKRGKIVILDRPGLEDYTCECYEVIKAAYAQK